MSKFYYQHIGILTNNFWTEGGTTAEARDKMSIILQSADGILENCVVFEDDTAILDEFVRKIRETAGLFQMQHWDKYGEIADAFITTDPVAKLPEYLCAVNPEYDGKLDKITGIPIRVLVEDTRSIYFLYGREDITNAHRIYVATALLLALDVIHKHGSTPGLVITLPYGAHRNMPLVHRWSALSGTGVPYPDFEVVDNQSGSGDVAGNGKSAAGNGAAGNSG